MHQLSTPFDLLDMFLCKLKYVLPVWPVYRYNITLINPFLSKWIEISIFNDSRQALNHTILSNISWFVRVCLHILDGSSCSIVCSIWSGFQAKYDNCCQSFATAVQFETSKLRVSSFVSKFLETRFEFYLENLVWNYTKTNW